MQPMRLIEANLMLLTIQSLLAAGGLDILTQAEISTYGIGTVQKYKTFQIPNFQYSYPILSDIYDKINPIISDQ